MCVQAHAQEPVGCDKFKWPLDKERATLTGTDLPKIVSGTAVPFPFPPAPSPPRHRSPTPSYRRRQSRRRNRPTASLDSLQVPAPKRAGSYKITVSDPAWIDVIQAGKTVKSADFSGALSCEGVRKSVKFDLAAAQFAIELSSIKADEIKLAISGD